VYDPAATPLSVHEVAATVLLGEVPQAAAVVVPVVRCT